MGIMYDTFKSLLPKGELFRIKKNGTVQKLNTGMTKELDRIILYYNDINNSVFPCENTPDDNIDDWRQILGFRFNNTTKADLIAKYFSIGGQSAYYLQTQLHAAGFTNIFVYENIIEYNPGAVGPCLTQLNDFQLGDYGLGEFVGRSNPVIRDGVVIANSSVFGRVKDYIGCQLEDDLQLNDFHIGEYSSTSEKPSELNQFIPANVGRWMFVFYLAGINGQDDVIDLTQDEVNRIFEIVVTVKPVHTWGLLRCNII